MDMFEDTAPGPGNAPEYSVSELSGAVKRVIEGEFGLVRVRGEIGRVSRPASGHLYFDLKDDRSVIAAISWKGQVARMQVRPEEGMEVVATGRMTTFPGQSKYQLIVDDVAPAGAGALMAMLEKRRAALQAEGLFDPARKQAIPYLPGVIGVITSPSGAVIRDILHRLRDRFPRHVLIWPVAVQGQACAPEVSAAIRGFNAMPAGGPVPRPDVIIVARGGGSLEDLWGFNEEIVVRAAAESRIPLISAVGHETDTTLIDYAADLRAPTPTAAAELAVPVRLDLLATVADLAARQGRAVGYGVERRGQRLRDLSRALPRPDAMTGAAQQRLDHATAKLGGALGLLVSAKRGGFERVAGLMRPELLLGLVARRGEAVKSQTSRLHDRAERGFERRQLAFDNWSARLSPALAGLLRRSDDQIARGKERVLQAGERLERAQARRMADLKRQLEERDRMRLTLGYDETLKRGFAVIRGDGQVMTSRAEAAKAVQLEAQFHDGRLALGQGQMVDLGSTAPVAAPAKPAPTRPRKAKPEDDSGQGSLL
ncbi:exodeoxyribonuclease VII large subunit [Xinfangfangia sp. CPCC 101601]|uniref:Exodeoxyribonuclease 7 large subunit n=1 Tax=Pseudogemmobacter lacusdianii TaxID=3069608 RepID=A0ABU0VVR1_9RHOB|nr:exodeoxyribonuclease VII large subunit [Xinfangfangia sp. CPCC 101601]MDQ2065836.1 exodeoxyribonuclease VII large subunit [Xinfangfangia sp. CPCC 101601]